MLQSSKVLVDYDSKKPLVLTCDSSPYDIGVVLSHVMDGVERPISCPSRTLSPAEKNSPLQKESLSIVWGVKKFHSYLYGCHFVIKNDHKLLETFFSEKNRRRHRVEYPDGH